MQIQIMPPQKTSIESVRAAAEDAWDLNNTAQFFKAWEGSIALLKRASHREEAMRIQTTLIDSLLCHLRNGNVPVTDLLPRLQAILQDHCALLVKHLVEHPGDGRNQREVLDRVASCLRYGGESASDFITKWCVTVFCNLFIPLTRTSAYCRRFIIYPRRRGKPPYLSLCRQSASNGYSMSKIRRRRSCSGKLSALSSGRCQLMRKWSVESSSYSYMQETTNFHARA